MKNFMIAHFICSNDYRIIPTTPIADSLVTHCNNRGDKLIYSTLEQAQSAVDGMERAIENRHGRPWMVFQETGYGLS
jgi:hypothetical protein